MISISHKAKQLLIFVAKLLIVVGAFYFIYSRLVKLDGLNWAVFIEKLKFQPKIVVLLILFLSFLNIFLEIIKWKNLVSVLKIISLKTATKEVLSSFTSGILTPIGLGGYISKTFYYPKKNIQLILFLNFLSNGSQLIITLIFGLVGLVILKYYAIAIVALFVLFGGFLFFKFTKNVLIKGFSFQKLWNTIFQIPRKIQYKNVTLSIVRYVIFSHQYYFLFLLLGINVSYLEIYFTITMVYFLTAFVPSFQLFDVAIKGSFALFLFQKLGISAEIIIYTTTTMWFLNTVIPVFLGSYYVATFNSKKVLA